ncbi:hypothetical protein OXX80_003859 [Metschnikowia pulcherrima]
MKTGIGALATAFVCLFGVISAVTITQNTVEVSPISLSLGELYINPGVYYSIVNNFQTLLARSVYNKGGLFITAADSYTASVTMTGDTFMNSGIVSFNSLSASKISQYYITTITSFSNTGSMFFGVSGATLLNTPYYVKSVYSWSNTGMMVFKRTSGSAGSVVIHSSVDSSGVPTITNAGSICLYNTDWTQSTSIRGSGCITIGPESQFNLEMTAYGISAAQTFYLSSADSVLSIHGVVPGSSAYPTYRVAGFGGGNTININLSFSKFSYSATTGVLTLSSALFTVYFNIGTGYKSSLFSTNTAMMGRSIIYDGPPPNSAPAICSCEWSFPSVTTSLIASSTTAKSAANSVTSASFYSSSSSSPVTESTNVSELSSASASRSTVESSSSVVSDSSVISTTTTVADPFDFSSFFEKSDSSLTASLASVSSPSAAVEFSLTSSAIVASSLSSDYDLASISTLTSASSSSANSDSSLTSSSIVTSRSSAGLSSSLTSSLATASSSSVTFESSMSPSSIVASSSSAAFESSLSSSLATASGSSATFESSMSPSSIVASSSSADSSMLSAFDSSVIRDSTSSSSLAGLSLSSTSTSPVDFNSFITSSSGSTSGLSFAQKTSSGAISSLAMGTESVQRFTTTLVSSRSGDSSASEPDAASVTRSLSSFVSGKSSDENAISSSPGSVTDFPVISSSVFLGYHNSSVGMSSSSWNSVSSLAQGTKSTVTSRTNSGGLISTVSTGSMSADLFTASDFSLSATETTSAGASASATQPGTGGTSAPLSSRTNFPVSSSSILGVGPSFVSISGHSAASIDVSATAANPSTKASSVIASGSSVVFGFASASGKTTASSNQFGSSASIESATDAKNSIVLETPALVNTATVTSEFDHYGAVSTDGASTSGGDVVVNKPADDYEEASSIVSAISTDDFAVAETQAPLTIHFSSQATRQSTWVSVSTGSSESVSTASINIENSAWSYNLSLAMVVLSVLALAF